MAVRLSTFTERLNYSISPLIVFLLAGICLLVTYNAQAICWTPATFTDAMTEYVNNYCAGSATQIPYLSDDEVILSVERPSSQSNILNGSSFLLMFLAFSFLLPYFVWTLLKSIQNGIDINALSSITKVESTDFNDHRSSAKSVSAYLHDHLTNRRASVILLCCFIFTLSLCVLNAVVQFFILEHSIFDRKFYPVSVVTAFRENQPWPESKTFPRVVLCDMNVRVLGNVHRHTVQCSLQYNDFLEKIFLFLWFWILFCLIWNVGALIYWTFVSLFSFLRVKFIARHLIRGPREMPTNQDLLWDFAVNFIGVDGAFILRLLEDAYGYSFVSEIIRSLLDNRDRQNYGSNQKYAHMQESMAGKIDHSQYAMNPDIKENLAKDLFSIERRPIINDLDVEGRQWDTKKYNDYDGNIAVKNQYKPLLFDSVSPSAPNEHE